MPEVIGQYKVNKDQSLEAFRAVRQLQRQLILHYESDFSKYAGSTNSRHIERVFRAIPLQLANTQDKKSKKFKFKDVISRGYRSYEHLADPDRVANQGRTRLKGEYESTSVDTYYGRCKGKHFQTPFI